MSEPVKPALTPEEWKVLADALEPLLDAASWGAEYGESSQASSDHSRLARIQEGFTSGLPFGFQKADADTLRDIAREMPGLTGYWRYVLNHVAEKIEALLPT